MNRLDLKKLNLSDLILLLIKANEGRIEGRTLVQKLVYFLARVYKLPLSQQPHFRAGLYGPYSKDVASELLKLVALDFLSEETKVTSVGNLIYTYSLTEDGEKVLQKILTEHQEEYYLIKKFVDKIGREKSEDLIVASKIHYIVEEDPQLISDPEKIVSKAENYGWEIKLEEIDKSIKILRLIGYDK